MILLLSALIACDFSPAPSDAPVPMASTTEGLAPGPFGDTSDTDTPPLDSFRDSGWTQRPPRAGYTLATEGDPVDVLTQSVVCYTLVGSDTVPGPVGMVAIGMDDGQVALISESQDPGLRPVGSIIAQGNMVVYPAGVRGSAVWTVLNLSTGGLQTYGPSGDVNWASQVGRRSYAHAFTELREHGSVRQMVRERPPTRTTTSVFGWDRIGATPDELLVVANGPENVVDFMDMPTLQRGRRVVLRDLRTWIRSLSGVGDRLYVLDEGTGTWADDYGQRLGVFDGQTGQNLSNVFFGDDASQTPRLQLAGFGPMLPSGLICEET